MNFFEEPNNIHLPPEGRVEAIAKVTGAGKYSAEYELPGICHAVLVGSTIAAGRISTINVDEAMLSSGVVDIITHLHKPGVPGWSDETKIKESRLGLPVFFTDKIYFKGQPVAMVIAESFEKATYAASLVKASYIAENFEVDFDTAQEKVPLSNTGKERGSVTAWAEAPVIVDAGFSIKAEVHHPMEMHATIAHWVSNDRLKLYDKNQGVNNVQRTIARLFSIPVENVEVISEFVGGGFGSGLRVWPHTMAAVLAARQVKKPVKLVLTRQQMFCSVGYRPASWQRVKMGADTDGKFLGVLHQAKNGTSVYESFAEGITRITRLVYGFANLKTESAVVPLNLSTPTWMRGPGDCTGDFAIESAIDELSYRLNMDPVALRLKNLSLEKNPDNGLPWSTNYIKECIEKGVGMINWSRRKPLPAAQKEGEWYIGYGMAVGLWNAGRGNASAAAIMQQDGTIVVQTAMTDIGTGTGTGMQNVAHEITGIPKNKINIELGNSTLPPAPSQGGSNGLSSITGAVVAACNALKEKLAQYAAAINEAYKNVAVTDIVLTENSIVLKNNNNTAISYVQLWQKNKLTLVEVEASSGPGAERQQYAFCSSAAHFCRVKVHEKTGKVKIDQLVSVADGGKIVNEKAAANQMSGAAVGGIGMALMEEMPLDATMGCMIGDDFAGYHFPVNADAPVIQVGFIGKPDMNINPTGAKGLGEVGIIGTAAAIANALYNATGKRFRNLPITPDKILM